MSLDKIVVTVLALLFFGGVILLMVKNRQAKGGEDQSLQASSGSQNEKRISPSLSKEQRKLK